MGRGITYINDSDRHEQQTNDVQVGYFLAGLATIPIVISADLWPLLVLVSTVASALLMALFFNPGLMIGLAVDATLIALVVVTSWRPA